MSLSSQSTNICKSALHTPMVYARIGSQVELKVDRLGEIRDQTGPGCSVAHGGHVLPSPGLSWNSSLMWDGWKMMMMDRCCHHLQTSWVFAYVYIYIHTHIYIYIYIISHHPKFASYVAVHVVRAIQAMHLSVQTCPNDDLLICWPRPRTVLPPEFAVALQDGRRTAG